MKRLTGLLVALALGLALCQSSAVAQEPVPAKQPAAGARGDANRGKAGQAPPEKSPEEQLLEFQARVIIPFFPLILVFLLVWLIFAVMARGKG